MGVDSSVGPGVGGDGHGGNGTLEAQGEEKQRILHTEGCQIESKRGIINLKRPL